MSRTRCGVAVGVVDDEDVALGRDEGPGPVEEVRAPTPTAAPTRRRPRLSLAASGYWILLRMSL